MPILSQPILIILNLIQNPNPIADYFNNFKILSFQTRIRISIWINDFCI